ncbi:serine/threonine-protein phosphatase [Treponema parvum]|uniref:Serine/threonine-protein phosphatase n=1 Tax=Treponema parvum TaxID=138851 RepID=A0A975IBW1_9SPIR|nr:PP2C family protein-serine/threonine phosphatase [Treponema parvum]QTQ11203.1 serine/threonine-protein phosphatase [Treponema parvum]
MIRTQAKFIRAICNFTAAVLSVIIAFFIFPHHAANFSKNFTVILISACICLVLSLKRKILVRSITFIENRGLSGGETAVLLQFVKSLRNCYSYDDFFSASADILEIQGGCSVIYIDSAQNYVLYNSPDRIASSPHITKILQHNFPYTWEDGIYFLDRKFGLKHKSAGSFGILCCVGTYHLFIIGSSAQRFDSAVYPVLLYEMRRFQNHTKIISEMEKISELSREWRKLAETQRYFLPQKMPEIKGLKAASFFKPLINVSGDYYSMLPVSQTKAIVLLGDVSGKGLASALIMGIAMNTVKSAEDKEDLVAIVKAIDHSIKEMRLQDKYTVLFIGLIDTEDMSLKYVNASVDDAMIFFRNEDGISMKRLNPNCSILGIIDLEEIHVDVCALRQEDVLFLASDGVSEVKNKSGEDLGGTEIYLEMLKESSILSPDDFLKRVMHLVQKFCNNKLHDDIAMLAVKVSTGGKQ